MQMPNINRLQFYLLIIIVVIGGDLNIMPSTVISMGNKDGWISILLSTLICTFLPILYIALVKEYYNNTFVEMTSRITSKYLGRVICLLYCLFFLELTADAINMFAFYINIFYFPETPIIVFIVMIVILLFAINYYGIKTLSRFNEFMFPLIIVGIFSTFLFLTPQMKFDNILPVFHEGMVPIIRGSIPMVGLLFGQSVIFVFLYPYLSNRKNLKIFAPITFLSIGIILTITTLATIFILDINEITITSFTVYETARLIKFGDTVMRIESLFGLTFLLALFIKMAVYSYFTLALFNQTFNIKKEKIVLVPLLIIIASYSLFIFSTYIEFENATMMVTLLITFFGYVLPIILLVAHYIKKRYRRRYEN